MSEAPALVFMWENFGPMHIDRCEAVAAAFRGKRQVIGIELGGRSDTYDWDPSNTALFTKITLFPTETVATVSSIKQLVVLVRVCCGLERQISFFATTSS